MDSEETLGKTVEGLFNIIIEEVGSRKIKSSGDELGTLVLSAYTILTAVEFIGPSSNFFDVVSFSPERKEVIVKRRRYLKGDKK